MEATALIEQQEDAQHGRYLAFDLDEEVFGLDIQFVTEIIGMQAITKIPEIAAYIMGIINLRQNYTRDRHAAQVWQRSRRI